MIELWHEWNSVHSFKVRLVLAEKAIAWQSRPLELLRFEHLRPDYLQINPAGVVPTLVHDQKLVTESSVICQYLDDAFPQAPLTPAAPHARAVARAWLKFFDDDVHAAVRTASFQLLYRPLLASLPAQELEARLSRHPDPQRARAFREAARGGFDEAAVARSIERFSYFIQRIEDAAARDPWLAGRDFSLADVAMAPFAERLVHLRLSHLWDGHPHARDWMSRILARPSVVSSGAPKEHRLPSPEERRGR
jgi:glutathione S-transferase